MSYHVCVVNSTHRDEFVAKGIKNKGMELEAARWYVTQIVAALEYLHVKKDVVHRDLKPENILISKKGQVQITDFGTAKVLLPRARIAWLLPHSSCGRIPW